MGPLINMVTDKWFDQIYDNRACLPSFRNSLYESDRSKKLLLQFTTARLKCPGYEGKTDMKVLILLLSLITYLVNLSELKKDKQVIDKFLKIFSAQKLCIYTLFLLMGLTNSSWNSHTHTRTHAYTQSGMTNSFCLSVTVLGFALEFLHLSIPFVPRQIGVSGYHNTHTHA